MSKKKRQLLLMVALSVVGVLALSASVLYILRHFGLEAVLSWSSPARAPGGAG